MSLSEALKLVKRAKEAILEGQDSMALEYLEYAGKNLEISIESLKQIQKALTQAENHLP